MSVGGTVDDRPSIADRGAWKWVERDLRRELSDDHRRAVQVICAAVAPYNLRTKWRRATWYPWGAVTLVLGGELATHDFNNLTKMVVAAHDHRMRLSIEGVGPGYVRLAVHPRETRDTRDQIRSHPTMEEAVEIARHGPRR